MLTRDNLFIFFIILTGTIFTVTYRVRLFFYLFFKNLGVKRILHMEERKIIFLPIRILFLLSVAGGRILAWNYFPVYNIFLPATFKFIILVSITVFAGFIYDKIVNLGLDEKINFSSKLFYFVRTMWFIPFVSTYFFMPALTAGKILIKFLDQGWVEQIGGQGSYRQIILGSSKADYFYLLNLKSYLLMFLIILLFLFVYIYSDSLN